MTGVEITPLGDSALVVRSPRARELLADLAARPLPGVLDAVPALDVLTVLYDPLAVEAEKLTAQLTARITNLRPGQAKMARTHVLPVTFDGPDLAWCAARAGRSVPDFVQALCSVTLTVAFLGFTPGFAFLAGLPEELRMPRLDAPRERVPAGSVALGGPWAGVYPRETPGGWRLVGRTDIVLFDLQRPEPVLWRTGDRVRFEAGP